MLGGDRMAGARQGAATVMREPARISRTAWRHRGRALVVAAIGTAVLVVSACSSGSRATTAAGVGQSPAGDTLRRAASDSTVPPSPSRTAAARPAVITVAPVRTTQINPTIPIRVAVTGGRLTAVRLINPVKDTLVKGRTTADGSAWTSAEVLGYAQTYALSAVAEDPAGRRVSKTISLTTLAPANMTMPYLNTTAGLALQNGATYGVGIVPVVHFDEPVTDRGAAEKALIVTTSPRLTGVWNWVDNQNVHWRPRTYFPTGTKVTMTAKVYGVQVGPGLYGQSDQRVSFTIGAKHVSVADDRTHTVKVYFNDKLVRAMPTSMGQGGWVTGAGGQQISLWTMPGTYTVIGHRDPVLMDSSTYGLPVNSPKGYKEYIYKATQISTDGIYLHQLDSTVWAQGNTDVSHGCLNLNRANAQFFYTASRVGDVVQVINTGGPKLQIWQNGDWSVPWSTWTKGSALR